MKFLVSQIIFLMQNKESSRNIFSLLKFLAILCLLIFAYSVIFHFLMIYEDRSYSWLTGLYWTLTVMSTLGFGDITFYSDLGRFFSIIVLISGIIFLLVMLPFTFIQFFYAPWLNAQNRLRIPRVLTKEISEHVLIVGTSPTAIDLSQELTKYGYKAYLLCSDLPKAIELYNLDFLVVSGEYDDIQTYNNLQVDQARMLVALDDDIKNTSVTFTVRESSRRVPIVCSVEQEASQDILKLAGANYAMQFTKMLGEVLARRALVGMHTGVIGEFGDLLVTETPIMRTQLVGKTLRTLNLRSKLGINVAGLWVRGRFQLPDPDEVLLDSTVLVLVGNKKQKDDFDSFIKRKDITDSPVIILGGGKVGQAAAEYFDKQNIDFRIVDKKPLNTKHHTKLIIGNAADIEVLEKAGINKAQTVLITTHDDDMNTYLTIYCRRLKPELQIISRATLDRNISILHTAGADLVMSYASLVANTIINILSPGQVLMLSEGLNIFKSPMPSTLASKTLAETHIRQDSNCNVIALIENGEAIANPSPDTVLNPSQELVIIGDSQSESLFREKYFAIGSGA